MRIIPFVVFYIATCVARIAIAGDIANTMPGSGVKYIFKQKDEATRNRVPELPIDGKIQTISKRNRRPLLENRIDGFPRSGTILNNLKQIERSLGKRERYAKSSDSEIANRRDDYPNDDNTNDEKRFPIWRVPESTVDAINLDSTSPSIVETGMIDRLSLESERPLQSENLGDNHSANEAVAGRYQNSRELFQLNASNRNLMLPKLASPKSRIKTGKPDKKMSSPAYRPGILAGTNLPNFSGRLQGFQRLPSQRDSSKELFNNRPTGSNELFLLVPVSKGLYVLKNIRESPRSAEIIVPKRYKPSNKDNTMSAVRSFKAHMHHDGKDVGKAYLQKSDHRLFDHNANYLYPKEGANPTKNPVPSYYPDFLYSDTAFQTGPNSVDDIPKNSEQQAVSPVLDCNSLGGINSYDSSSSFLDISDYDVSSKKDANDDQSRVLSTTKLDDEVNLFQQGNYVNYSLGYNEFGVELTTVDFQNTFGNVYTPATLENVEMYLTNDDKEVFDVSREDEFKFSTGSDEDKPTTGFADDISTQHRAAFDASANEDNTFLSNITRAFVDNVISNTEDVDEDNQAYEISIPDEYNYKKSKLSNDFDYDNRFIDGVLLSNCTTVMDSLLNVDDYVTSAPLLPNTDGWSSKIAQSNVENSHSLLMAIKPLSSDLEKLLNAVQLINRSISDMQSKLCDKKNVVRSAKTEQEGRDRKATNIARPADKVDYYNSDLSAKSFDSQSSDRRRDKTEGRSAAERNVKIRRETNGLFLNKLTTPFRKRGSSIGDSEIRIERENEKRKLSEGEFPKSDDVVGRRLPHSRFNRNLKSLTKSYGTRVKPIRQLIESELKRTQRTMTPIIRTSRLTKSNVSSENNFAGGYARDHRGNYHKDKSIISSNKTPFWNISTKKENLVDFLSDDKQGLTQRNVKRAMSSKISTSGEEKTFPTVDLDFYKEATTYLDVLRLLGKMETPHVEYVTNIVWTTQPPTDSPLIFTATEFSVSTSTFFSLNFTEVFETTESFLHEYVTVTDFQYGKDYDKRNYTRMIENYRDEDITSKISTQSPVTLSAFTITMPTALPLYTTELTTLLLDKIAPKRLFLEGMNVMIPATTKILIEEITPALIAGTAITEEETEEDTSTTLATEITQSSLVEINISSYTFSTVSLFESTETEWTIKTATSTVPVSITLTVTKGPQTVTSKSTLGENLTLYEAQSTASVASSPTIFKRTETTISTSTEVATTTLTPEENESPVSQIEKTITAEETATEIPTTIETPTSTETTITAVETSTIVKISTTMEATIATETSIPTDIVTHTTWTSISPTTIVTTTTKTLTPTEIVTTLRTPITKETTSAKTLIPTETNNKTTWTSIETSETTTTTEITETVTATRTSVFTETPATSKILTTSTIPTIIETTTIAETLTAIKITATIKIPMTEKITSTKVLTPTAIKTSSYKTQIITEIPATFESLGTTEISVISTTYITTKFYTSESTISSVATMPPNEFFPMSTPTPFTVVFTTKTAESTLTSTITPVATSFVKTAVPTMKLTTSSQTLLTTPSKTSYFTISSMSTTTKGPVTTTSFKTTIPTTSLKVTTTTLVTSTMPSETAATIEKTLEAETEYYFAKEPFYDEEYEEYEDSEIPTDKWYYYDEYETTTTVTRKYTKLPKEKTTSSPFIKGTTTSLYETETSEFTRYPTPSETILTYINMTSTMATSEIYYTYTEKEITSTSALEISALITIENVTTPETEFTASTVNEEVESTTTRSTFGSTEEYTLPSSTIFKISTKSLEHLSIPPKYTDLEHFTQISSVTSPKFITKFKEIPEIVLKKTTTSERVSTEVEVETLTSFFVSSVLTTLSEKEVFEVHVTTTSTATPEMESIFETGYEVTTLEVTEEETIPRVTPFITSEAEIEPAFTTSSKTTVEREEHKEQLLQRIYDLKQREREIAEREERLKEREKQWYIEKEKRRKMIQRGKEKNITIVTGTTENNVTTIIAISITSPTVSIENLTVSTTETEITSFDFDTSSITLSSVEIITIPTETTSFSTTEESTSVTYTSEEAIIEGSTFTTYAAEETEQTIVSYTTEKSTSITYITKEMEVQITDYVTLEPYITTSIVDLYSISLTSVDITTPYAVEETSTSYVTLYSELSLTSPAITSPLTLITDKFTLPIATFSESFEETSVTSITTPTWYTTEERFTSSELQFTTTTILSTLAISTTAKLKYNEEIEKLKEKLRKMERELEEREKILLEREERLNKEIIEFEKYMEEFEKKTSASEKSTVLTSLSTPVPPTEETTLKAQLTTQIKKVTEKKENRTTTRIVTSRHTEVKDIEEKNCIKHTSEKIITPKKEEEEIVTKRIYLNVLENTIPLDKKRKDIVIKKVCLPYFPKRNEEKSGGRISRRLLALESTREIRGPKWNVPLDFRYRRKVKETTRKIDNLQLLHHEWLSNETTKPLPHFRGFTRIYKKIRKFPRKVATNIDAPRNTTGEFQGGTPLYEQRVLNHKSVFRPITTSMLDSKKDEEENIFFRYDLISTRKNYFPTDGKASVRKREVPIENNARFLSSNVSSQKATTAITDKDGITVNVLHLSYNENQQMYEVISAKPDEDELTGILSESNDDVYVTQIGEDEKITTPHCNIEEKDDLTEEYDDMSDKMMKKIEEDEDYIDDMIENYMNYEEHETSTRAHDGGFSDKGSKNKEITENDRELLDRAWPTEKSTTYHLGGTRFWELDFVTEPSTVLRTTTDKNKPIDESITRTTCFEVVLKNERDGEIKTNVSGRERNVYNNCNGPGERVSIEKQNAGLKNVTRTNASQQYKLGTKRPGAVAKKLKHDSQRLHRSNYNYYKRGFVEKGTVRLNGFRHASDEDSITAKCRKLCVVNANKLKRQTVKRDDAAGKRKKKRPAKSRASQSINVHSPHNTDNRTMNKKSKYRKTTNANRYSVVKYIGKKNEKVTHLDIIGRKSKSTSASDEKKIHSCFNCICDIASMVRKLRSLLDGTSFSLDEIKALNCSEYKKIQDEIVISTDFDMEEAREFPQPHYNTESLKGQKYIRLEELVDNFKGDSELDSDYDVISLPGLNLNLPCKQDGDGITWLSSVNKPSYTWKRTDGITLFGFVAENGDLELRNVNAKDTGNYTCVMTYMSSENEEPVEIAHEVHLQVVTMPRYIVHSESRYHVRTCDEGDLDMLVTYLPLKLNSIICEEDICNAYVLTPSCSRSQITVNILLVPSRVVKLTTADPKRCNVFCLKAIQDKLSLILSRNLQIFLGRTIIFRLPHYEQRLVPIIEKSSFARRKRGKTDAYASAERSGNVGLFFSCPAGYGLHNIRCVPCNVGTYSEDGISHCKKCPPGTFQPNHGARVCRTCTNPMTKGCYNMLWNSFSAVMVTLASVGAMLSICLLLLWIICCGKKKFCIKRRVGLVAKHDTFERKKHVEKQPLIKDASENDDQQLDRIKNKKEKFYVNKKRRKQNEKRKYDKTHLHEDEWGSHRIKNTPVINPDSYRSHEDYNNHYPKWSCRKGPLLPECDFDT